MQILYVANRLDSNIESLIKEYSSRLKVSLVLKRLKGQQNLSTSETRKRESAAILDSLKESKTIILLDEKGERLSSEQFANLSLELPKNASFVIGGSYGVDKTLYDRASRVIRLSDFVLPHQIALLVLVEQLYRAQCINSGHPYHHTE